jgi:hypothetical protein
VLLRRANASLVPTSGAQAPALPDGAMGDGDGDSGYVLLLPVHSHTPFAHAQAPAERREGGGGVYRVSLATLRCLSGVRAEQHGLAANACRNTPRGEGQNQ